MALPSQLEGFHPAPPQQDRAMQVAGMVSFPLGELTPADVPPGGCVSAGAGMAQAFCVFLQTALLLPASLGPEVICWVCQWELLASLL